MVKCPERTGTITGNLRAQKRRGIYEEYSVRWDDQNPKGIDGKAFDGLFTRKALAPVES